ncbi:MAG: PEP-CTERM sorting domain-containing protein [Sedimentisphaerales bacterium]|nr:PEP-CTERM sorting domain-containing protein [Sedimentisphaerales bacterium]
MMKKLLALVLVLGMAGIASAGFVVTGPDRDLMPGEAFQLIVSGMVADVGAGLSGGIYGPVDAESADVLVAAGNLGSVNYYPEYGGWDFVVGDVPDASNENNPADGNWIIFNFAPAPEGEHFFDIYDYGFSFSEPITSVRVNVIPEPMTLGLLGLGALFLRRRK